LEYQQVAQQLLLIFLDVEDNSRRAARLQSGNWAACCIMSKTFSSRS